MLAASTPAIRLLRLLTLLLLLGWAWQLVRRPLPGLGYDEVAVFQWVGGTLLALLGLAAVALPLRRQLDWSLMGLASLVLLGIFGLLFRDHAWQWGNLIEHSIQWSLPLLLVYVWWNGYDQLSQWSMRLVIAATFLGHGLYAIGYYPVPGNYIQMVHLILGLDAAAAEKLLFAAGVLDILTALSLLIPGLWRYALYYAIVWGFMTAMARVVAYFDLSHWQSSLDLWLNQSLIRLGHGGVPLALWWVEREK